MTRDRITVPAGVNAQFEAFSTYIYPNKDIFLSGTNDVPVIKVSTPDDFKNLHSTLKSQAIGLLGLSDEILQRPKGQDEKFKLVTVGWQLSSSLMGIANSFEEDAREVFKKGVPAVALPIVYEPIFYDPNPPKKSYKIVRPFLPPFLRDPTQEGDKILNLYMSELVNHYRYNPKDIDYILKPKPRKDAEIAFKFENTRILVNAFKMYIVWLNPESE